MGMDADGRQREGKEGKGGKKHGRREGNRGIIGRRKQVLPGGARLPRSNPLPGKSQACLATAACQHLN